jgi:hypothetical protein
MVKQFAHDKLIIGQVQSGGLNENRRSIIYNNILINTKNLVFYEILFKVKY